MTWRWTEGGKEGDASQASPSISFIQEAGATEIGRLAFDCMHVVMLSWTDSNLRYSVFKKKKKGSAGTFCTVCMMDREPPRESK